MEPTAIPSVIRFNLALPQVYLQFAWPGLVVLAAGVFMANRGRHFRLLWFTASILLSHLLMTILGITHHHDSDVYDLAFPLFPVLQISLTMYLVYRLEGMRIPAFILSVFALSYAGLAFLLFVFGQPEL